MLYCNINAVKLLMKTRDFLYVALHFIKFPDFDQRMCGFSERGLYTLPERERLSTSILSVGGSYIYLTYSFFSCVHILDTYDPVTGEAIDIRLSANQHLVARLTSFWLPR